MSAEIVTLPGLRDEKSESALVAGGLRVVAMVSGKGGVGKTNLSVNMALALSQRGRRVLLVDADLGLANVDIVLGLTTRYTLYDVVMGNVALAEILVEGPGGIWVMPASSGVYEMTCLDDEQRYDLLSQLDGLEDRFDTVIIDNAAGISRDVQFLAGAAREVMVVTDREPTSITDAYATIKVLSQRRTNRHFHLLVNNTRQESDALDVYKRLTQVADRFLDVSISLFGSVPRDENLNRAVMARRPLLELFPDSPAAERIRQLADKLLRMPPPEGLDGGMKMFWERLFRQGGNGREDK
ncbi:MAG: MinD/ParA family protein [Deltaproteobacteria bacterium]|nr:MAG: MinD/ParA family protein [Deltaproteobacteria bacterium]